VLSFVAKQVFCLFEVRFNSNFFHSGIHLKPTLPEVRVKVSFFAGKLIALKTKIHALHFIAANDSTIWVFTGSSPAPQTIALC
jgi:hypothetical protein